MKDNALTLVTDFFFFFLLLQPILSDNPVILMHQQTHLTFGSHVNTVHQEFYGFL
jgi:hypothetical protein